MIQGFPIFRLFLCCSLPCLFQVPALAQDNLLKGKVVDSSENKKLQHSIIALIDLTDSTLYTSVRADQQGDFLIRHIPPGRYTVMIAYPKMADFLQDIDITDTSIIDLATINMISDAVLLEEVVVRANMAMRMRGDTLEYKADSFAVRPGANVEELLRRLPGIEVDAKGKIQAQGKAVNKILVDGDEFFSDDPIFAARFLRADAVDKVQVFDKKSEEAELTGVDDGKRSKTINLALKENKKNGYFGKLSAGSDLKDYYQYEGMASLFNGNKKASVFASSSRIGDRSQLLGELTKYVEEDMEAIEDGTGSMRVYQGGGYRDELEGGSGIPSIVTAGAHFSNKWKEGRQRLLANYRFNQTDTEDWSNSEETMTLPDGTGFFNVNRDSSESRSFGQQANAGFTTPVDSVNIFRMNIKGNTGNNRRWSSGMSSSRNEKDHMVNSSNQSDSSSGDNRNFATNLSYLHRLGKKGGTLLLTLQQEYGEQDNDNYVFAANEYFDPLTGNFLRNDTLDQLQRSHDISETYAAKLGYSLRMNEKSSFQLSYGFKSVAAGNEYNVLDGDGGRKNYLEHIDSLSSNYRFRYATHISSAIWSGTILKKIQVMTGANMFVTDFRQTDRDLGLTRKRNFVNFAPQARIGMGQSALRVDLGYSGNTQQPTIEQLQPLRRSSDGLFVQLGNPDLRPSFMHNFNLSMSRFNLAQGRMLYGSVYVNYISNGITSKSTIDAQNRQETQYINMNGIPGINASMGYSWRMDKWKLQPSLSASFSRNGSYIFQNNQRVKNSSTSYSTGLMLVKTWKDVGQLQYYGRASFSEGRSTAADYQTRRNISHMHNIAGSFLLPWKLEFQSDCDMNFQPKNSVFNKSLNVIQWNMHVQKKFLRSEELSLRLSVDDLLNNNTGYNRSVSGNTVSESNELVVKRYWMLTLAWNFSRSL